MQLQTVKQEMVDVKVNFTRSLKYSPFAINEQMLALRLEAIDRQVGKFSYANCTCTRRL